MARDIFYENFVRPTLFRLDPEDAHHLIYDLLRTAGCPLPGLRYEADDLKTTIVGTTLPNPVGLAAGFDKNGYLVKVLGNLGFGFAEVGSLTGQASQGNPRPRLFRLEKDEALINRLGLNGEGADAVGKRLQAQQFSLPVAVNIAKTNDPSISGDKAVEDIVHSFRQVKRLPLIYVAINASCPNTSEGCLKEVQELETYFIEMQKENENKIPLFVKVSPDSSDQLLHDIVNVANRQNISGFVCGNTTVARDQLSTAQEKVQQIGWGGLSGPPLRKAALALCRKIFQLKTAEQTIIAVGGIASGDDAYEFICAGASAVEIYTALIYRGPSLPKQICESLSQRLRAESLTLSDAVGKDFKR